VGEERRITGNYQVPDLHRRLAAPGWRDSGIGPKSVVERTTASFSPREFSEKSVAPRSMLTTGRGELFSNWK
jgi:hypothetical protein